MQTEPIEMPIDVIDKATGKLNAVGRAMADLATKEKNAFTQNTAKKHYDDKCKWASSPEIEAGILKATFGAAT